MKIDPKPLERSLKIADALCEEGVLISGSLCEPERSEIARIIDKIMSEEWPQPSNQP